MKTQMEISNKIMEIEEEVKALVELGAALASYLDGYRDGVAVCK